MLEVAELWTSFGFASLLIVIGGFFLVRSADRISDISGLGKTWAGVLLLATATSIPELVVGLGAIITTDSPDLAAGGAFGSNTVNILLLAMLGLIPAWRGLLTERSDEAASLGTYGIVLTASAGAMVLLGKVDVVEDMYLLAVLPLALPVLYLVSVNRIFGGEMSLVSIDPKRLIIFRPQEIRLSQAGKLPSFVPHVVIYAAAAGGVVFAGFWLSDTGGRLSDELGWSQSFVGSFFLAISTSLPEAVVAVAALRIGSTELALANLLGSNMFNMGIVLGADAAIFGTGEFFIEAGTIHALTALASIVMTVLVLYRPWPSPEFGRPARHHSQVRITAAGVLALFIATSYAQFYRG